MSLTLQNAHALQSQALQLLVYLELHECTQHITQQMSEC